MAAERIFKLTFLGDAKKALGELGKLDKGMETTGQKARKAGKVVATGFATAAVTGIGAAIKSAADFEAQFSEVQTLLPNMDTSGIENLRKEVLDMSKEFGIATDQAVPAFYSAISAGVPPDNIADFMSTAAKLSLGGVTDLETAVDGLSSVVNAYGSEVIDAQRAADVMFTGVKLGKTTVDELSASLFQVIPTAASLGVTFEEVTAALAVMTAQGVPTSVATTQLRQAFVEASKSGTKLDKAIKELHGESFAGLIKQGGTASEILESVRESMPEQEFKDLFGSVEAMNAVLQITGPNAESMASALGEMNSAAGATDEAFRTVSDTAQFKFNKAMNGLKVLMVELGSELLPIVVKFLEVVLKIPTPVLAIGLAFGTVAVAAGVLVAALGPLALLFSPVGLIVVGIGAVIAAGVLLWKNWDTITEKAGQFAGFLTSTVGGAISFIIGLLEDFIGAVGRAKDALGSIPTPGDVASKLPGSGSGIADAAGFIGNKGLDAIPVIGLAKQGFGALFKANGGPVSGGRPYIVGERGPELFVPGSSGNIIPNGGGGGVNVHVHIDGFFGDEMALERVMQRTFSRMDIRGRIAGITP